MADKTIPFGKSGISANLLPNFYQTPANKKFLQATLDQLYQPGTATKVNGYVGRQNSKASTGDDLFVAAADTTRQNYQLEPGVVITNAAGNNTFFKDYIDYINQVNVFGGNTSNHARLNNQEMYSWDPHIDWDKFVNFQNYYWMPYGPEAINVVNNISNTASIYDVSVVDVDGTLKFIFTPDGVTDNPVIRLYRGQTYTFNINSGTHPFSFKTKRTIGDSFRYTDGVSNSAVTTGTITFTVGNSAPSILFYQSETDINLGGAIEILSIDEFSEFNIETDLLGKKSYTLPNGLQLSNGMKLTFANNAIPASYTTGQYYVEGVGTAIKLVPSEVLEIINPFTVNESIKFDSTPFDTDPFADATGFASIKDYVVINRASRDHNPWSRYNRWFHKDVIIASALHNNTTPSLDQASRAVRPIIEFEADLRLFNFGTTATVDVDLIDDYTDDVFSKIEGTIGYNVDGVKLTDGQLVLFTADTDSMVANRIYRVKLLNIQGFRQIHLEEVATPSLNQTVLVRNGVKNQSATYWFNGETWIKAQQKSTVNQAPLFDVFDSSGASFGDKTVYTGSTFKGTSIFEYKKGTGPVDTVLGFSLAHKNVSNIGDIVFNFTLATDTFEYKQSAALAVGNVNVGFMASLDYAGNTHYVNGWQTCTASTIQPAIRIYKNSNITNNFNVDIFDNINDLADLEVRVYVNGIRIAATWQLVDGPVYKKVVLENDVATTDVVTIKAFAKQSINSNGHYEVPVNLQNNPLNDLMGDFTLGEVSNHVDSIIDNVYNNSNTLINFTGTFPGVSNLRDLGNVTQYGTKFVQHSGPASLAIYHVASESNNVIKAVEQARDDYGNFKRVFVSTVASLGRDGDPVQLVNEALQKINANKPNTAPYYFSDMAPYGACLRSDLTVVDYRIKTYPLTSVFSLETLSNKAVGVYLNGTQLIHGRDYTFNSQGFVVITADIATGDIVTTYEYETTDKCFIPETPTKLGIWPKYEPKLYKDTSLITPRWMIQGHDGSQILAYGSYDEGDSADYRDAVILELEKRIYNNIKVSYDTTIFNWADIVPAYHKSTPYSLTEFNQVLAPNFYKWAGLVGNNFSQHLTYDINNPFTYNYSNNYAPDNTTTPGYWRGVYRYMLGTDRPNITPWEMLGLTVEPAWWQDTYGPAPYTKDNYVMWQDIANGTLKAPGVPATVLVDYVRPYLMNSIPVDESGNLISPIECGLAQGTITPTVSSAFVFGDIGPVEAAWRRSSHYAFSMLITAILLSPAKVIGVLLDRSRISRNVAGQLVYSETGLRIRPTDVVLPSIYSSVTRVQTAGLVNYVVNLILNYIFSNNLKSYNSYSTDLDTMSINLTHRVGSFTNKDQYNLLLDSKTPASTGNVFIPKEDFSIILNKSSPIRKLTYSGVIITKLYSGFEITGYSKTQPYFNMYQYTRSGITVNVGGISESFSNWTPGEQYASGSVVRYNNNYYRTISLTTATATFDPSKFYVLGELPTIGGQTAVLRKGWDRDHVITVPYGTEFATIQEVVDFLTGYGEWLKDQGFTFNSYNQDLSNVSNWETAASEFLFWTTQNWSTGQDKWANWAPGTPVPYGNIVRYNGDYYSALSNVAGADIFNPDDYNKLDGLSTIGNSVISLSPGANGISFTTGVSVVDDITSSFNGYEIFKVDGTPLNPANLDSYSEDGTTTYVPRRGESIFGASFYLVQHEHVVVINNNTIFNDTIYNPESGYRQERIKISSYVTETWTGGLNIPGFIFDQAIVQNWQAWQDYSVGDMVNYQGYFYSANVFVAGSTSFDTANWTRLSKKPTAQILPNWTNLATQFTDFYSLDSEGFNTDQQTIAQHLIGYQKRQYLENIIQDDVSEFKFYQGMIRDKGTQNVFNNLFNVLGADGKDSLTFYEEWALRVGQYGASSAFESVEFVLNADEFRNNPQGIVLHERENLTQDAFTVQILPNKVYLKPQGYNSNPFPVLDELVPTFRTAGYVNSADVYLTVGTWEDIPQQNIAPITGGEYVWITFDSKLTNNKINGWGVYEIVETSTTINSVTYLGTTLTLTASANVPFAIDDYIGIAGANIVAGFYKVETVNGATFTVTATIAGFPEIFTHSADLVIYNFVSRRALSIDDAEITYNAPPSTGNRLWTDVAGNGSWATWEYKPAFEKLPVYNPLQQSAIAYGTAVAITRDSSIAVVGTSVGETIVYNKVGQTLPWSHRQVLAQPFIAPVEVLEYVGDTVAASSVVLMSQATSDLVGAFIAGPGIQSNTRILTVVPGVSIGISPAATSTDTDTTLVITKNSNNPATIATVVAISADGKWLATGSPFAGNAVTVTSNTNYTEISRTGTPNGLAECGAISLYVKDTNGIYSLVDSIASPTPAAYEHFGTSLEFTDNALYIGATAISGKVYKLKYSSSVVTSAFYNPVGSSSKTVTLSTTNGITLGMTITGTGFTSGQTVIDVVDSTTITISAAPDSTPSGLLDFSIAAWKNDNSEVYNGTTLNCGHLGKSIKISADGSTMLIVGNDSNSSSIHRIIPYRKVGSTFVKGTDITINAANSDVTVSSTGEYIAVCGGYVVKIYKWDGQYSLYQTLNNLGNQYFGNKISFLNDYQSLVIQSDIGAHTSLTVYDKYNDTWVFSESIDATLSDDVNAVMVASSNNILIGLPGNSTVGQLISYVKYPNTRAWTIKRTGSAVADLKKIKQAFLYNKQTGALVKHLDVVDPHQGKIPGVAEAEIRFKTFYDPASYNSTNGVLNEVSNETWFDAQVGMLWWDLSSVKFVDNHVNEESYRTTMWNTLVPGASVDVYEWVRSSLKPAVWDTKADTVEGIAAGVSGTSLYGNTVYSIKQTYDNISQSYKYTYYYWVKNKKVVPPVEGRHKSANEVANLIANPRGQGYTCLALTSSDSFALVNASQYLSDANVVLSVEYWTVDNTEQNIHTQWKIISNDPIVVLPSNIEQKWFDSLCGVDTEGRRVPDVSLAPKLRYGVENRPRQGMFVNRIEALKQFVEKANETLILNQVVETSDISLLNDFDAEPSIITGIYDAVFDTEVELAYANIGSFKQPSIVIQAANGAIVNASIVASGRGYVVAPYLEIIGTGTGAVVRAVIDTLGQITGVEIINAGTGYTSGTTCTVRNYAVLVHSDSNAANGWSVYSYDPKYKVWSRTLTQTYDVRRYWNYTDWYATGYNQFSSPEYAINTFSELNVINPAIGELVKVRNTSAGTWVLLKRFAVSTAVDWTQSYTLVGIEKGTIQLSSSLYDFVGTNIGYDSSTYDGESFDIAAALELRIILSVIKNNIFTGTLKQKYLDLFFTSVRYAFSEQVYIDWIFKTSFVRATYNLGYLDQPVNYPVDNLSNFEDYIAEVKPYRTKVREYVSNYTNTEQSKAAVTDFDLQPVFENGSVALINTTVSNGVLFADNQSIQTYPWKFWLDNVGFEITELVLVDGGAGYTEDPVVTIDAPSTQNGVQATAKAFITSGKVNRVILLTKGKGYLSAPTITIAGGTTPAKVVAIIGKSPVRANKLGIKFDRLTRQRYVTQRTQTETFTGSGSRLQFALVWAPDVRIGKSSVTINGVPALREKYKLAIVKSKAKGFTSFYGTLTFLTAPAKDAVISVTYNIDESVLDAVDRIEYFYNPATGDLGKDLAQLMTGIDYGGVVVNGLGFNVSGGWDSSPYYADKWDSFDPSYTDYSLTVASGTQEFILPYTPAIDASLNVYQTMVSESSYPSDGSTLEYSFDALTNRPEVTIAISATTDGYYETDFTMRGITTSGSIITMSVGSTAGVVPNMGIIGEGFTHKQTVQSVVNATTITINAVPTFNRVVDLDETINIVFTFNFAGSNLLTVADTSGIKVDDVVTSSTTSAFAYQTKVVDVVSSTNLVLSSIMFANLPDATAITFNRALTPTVDYVQASGASIALVNPVIAGASVIITGTYDPIRLDDPYYGTAQQQNVYAIMPTPIARSVSLITVATSGTYMSIPPVYIESSPLSANSDGYNATPGQVTMTAVSAQIVSAGTNYQVGDIFTVFNGDVTYRVDSLQSKSGNILSTQTGPNVEVSSTLGLVVGQSFIVTGPAGGGITPTTRYYVCAIVDSTHIKLSTHYADTLSGTFASFTAATITGTTFVAGSVSGCPKDLVLIESVSFTGSLDNTTQTAVLTTTGTPWAGSTVANVGTEIYYNGNHYIVSTPGTLDATPPTHSVGDATYGTAVLTYSFSTGVGCTLVVQYGVLNVAIEYGGFGYTTDPVVTLGRPWVANAEVTLGDDIFYQENHYVVTTGGTLDDQAPIHITGAITYGTAELTYNGTTGSIVADTSIGVIALPASYSAGNGDTFTIRQSTSDGSINAQANDYDTAISGGDLAYSTATGIAADDIVIDGDGFVTPTSSPATEEVVPGQVVDAVAIKVFDQPTSGSASVKVVTQVATGLTDRFAIQQIPSSASAVIVKTNDSINTLTDDYTVDYSTKEIVFNTIPTEGTRVSIFSIGFAGTNILDTDYFVGDDTTVEFITKANYQTTMTPLVYVDGVVVNATLFETDSSYDEHGLVGIRLDTPPAAGILINYIIVNGNEQTFSITKTETVPTDGVNKTYTLANTIGNSLPNEANMIVRVDQTILQGPNNSYFKIAKNRLNYKIDPTKFLPSTVYIEDIVVIIGGVKMTRGLEYDVDLGGITITITRPTYTKYAGKELVISILSGNAYSFDATTNQITFASQYDQTNTVEVISSYVHDANAVTRSTISITSTATLIPDSVEYYNYKSLSSGLIPLEHAVRNEHYVWVVKSGELLVPNVDYKLDSNKNGITLLEVPNGVDTIDVITFGNNVLSGSYAYMQFKDMLNRVSYKRLNINKRTKLALPLHWNDTTLTVVDASNLSVPHPELNRPGIIEVRGERIEYFAKSGNVLSRLRRGTLGTGVSDTVVVGAYVQDISSSENIPYTDTFATAQIISNGTTTVTLDFTPTSVNDIEVFVGGYDTTLEWAAGAAYKVNDIVNIGSYTYRCTSAHTSSIQFKADSAHWQFFVGNTRLKKGSYTVHNVNNAQYSPEGDVTFDADFALIYDANKNPTNQIKLTHALTIGTRVTVVKRTGVAWDSAIDLRLDNSKIANFIKAAPGSSYAEYD